MTIMSKDGEPPMKRQKVGHEFNMLPKVVGWEDISHEIVYKVGTFDEFRLFTLADSNKNCVVVELPASIADRVKVFDSKTIIYLKRSGQECEIAVVPRKICSHCKKHFASANSLASHRYKRCKLLNIIRES